MTRILITGTGGFVGSHILEAVLDRTSWEVVCLESFRHNGIVDRNIAAIEDTKNSSRWDRVEIVSHDLTVPLSYAQLRKIGEIDYLINNASRCHVGESIRDPITFVSNNVLLMLQVLELARTTRSTKFVQISTDEVYGPHVIRSVTDHRPSSPYAASKACQEDLCYAYSRTYDIPTTILNSCNMFGERQSSLAFIPRIVRALRENKYVQIHMHDGTPGKRNYVYVKNVADRIVDHLVHDPQPLDVHRLTVPGQREIDNFELFSMVADALGYDSSKYELVDAEKARSGYDPHYPSFGGPQTYGLDFSSALTRTVKWLDDNPDWLV